MKLKKYSTAFQPVRSNR